MAGFADLVPQAQPALFGAGVVASGTAGRTWLWPFTDVTDAAGDPIDLGDVTGTCVIVSAPGGPTIATLDFIGGLGEFSIGLSKTNTAGLPPTANGSAYHWSLTLTDGIDSVQVWGVTNSKFQIHQGA